MSARVKICGVTTVEDARAAVDLGADLLGLNFYSGSPRFVDASTARSLADAVRGRTRLVGVFVNSTIAEVEAIDAAVGLDLLQLHGDESAGFLAHFGARALPAVRWRGPEDAPRVRAQARAWGVLVEGRQRATAGDGGRDVPSAYGGIGAPWDYAQVAALAADVRLLLAGGLTPETVRAAIGAVRPWGVDVCSGVESRPGRKDRERMRRFIAEARSS